MSEPACRPPATLGVRGVVDRLESWKEIAAYLGLRCPSPPLPELPRRSHVRRLRARARGGLPRSRFVVREGERAGLPGAPHAARVLAPIAKVSHALGDEEGAFAWLEVAYNERDETLVALRVEPEWDNLRSNPRFVAIVRKTGVMP